MIFKRKETFNKLFRGEYVVKHKYYGEFYLVGIDELPECYRPNLHFIEVYDFFYVLSTKQNILSMSLIGDIHTEMWFKKYNPKQRYAV